MLKINNNKFFKICDDCGKIEELKSQAYKNNLNKERHYCGSCRQKGNKNPMYNKNPWNKGLSKENDERIKIYSEKVSNSQKGKIPWNKNLTKDKDERIKKYGLENSKTKKGYYHTLQYFIDKYGKEDGPIKYQELNNKKGLSLQNMINKYGKDLGYINYKKNIDNKYFNLNFSSKISQELFWEIDKLFNNNNFYFYEKNKEFGILDKLNKSYYYYDFVDTGNKKIIEFNGDYFHANPSKFTELDTPNPYNKTITSKDIWKSDNKKINAIEKLGYKVLIVWENDFKNNKEKIIKECISFLS